MLTVYLQENPSVILYKLNKKPKLYLYKYTKLVKIVSILLTSTRSSTNIKLQSRQVLQ